ncbi:hypothetical protein SAMN03080615_04108 [Amphritea atlantica]|uniref:Uncharacterized protein n=1 Tax=Amphritea atlantica TaxID=355243 RepID=A0A1H9LUU7_9GAMM|nr:hypothetical protein [Amphritea atlantica]SER15029.1 hypothetical protein SAMN03080615_04108 [Amphritea atlantica]
MRRLIIGVVAGMLLPLYPAFADSNDTIISQIQEATQDASTPEQISAAIEDMLANAESPEQQQAILTAAMSVYSADADALAAIGSAANNTGISPDVVTQSALAANVSPTDVLAATAAGNGNGQGPGNGNGQGNGQGLGIAPGQTGNPVTPPPFGNNGGGAGGGTGSPS